MKKSKIGFALLLISFSVTAFTPHFSHSHDSTHKGISSPGGWLGTAGSSTFISLAENEAELALGFTGLAAGVFVLSEPYLLSVLETAAKSEDHLKDWYDIPQASHKTAKCTHRPHHGIWMGQKI